MGNDSPKIAIIRDKQVTDGLKKLHFIFLQCLQLSSDMNDFYNMAQAMAHANSNDPNCTVEIVDDAINKMSTILKEIECRKKT